MLVLTNTSRSTDLRSGSIQVSVDSFYPLSKHSNSVSTQFTNRSSLLCANPVVVKRSHLLTRVQVHTYGNWNVKVGWNCKHNNGVYSLKWRLTDRYLRWGTLADPRPGRGHGYQCKSSEFLQELRISGFPRFWVTPLAFARNNDE